MASDEPCRSDVAKIDKILVHPVELFKIWKDEAKQHKVIATDACCLATASKDCQVSARNVMIKNFDNDGFVIVTDGRSKKIDNIKSVPRVAMCCLWCFKNTQKQMVIRQVKVEGIMKQLERKVAQDIYDEEPFYCKVRAHLCHQGQAVNWEKMKEEHDKILDSCRENKDTLSMPDHYVAYKLFPTMMEFYYARDYFIADRILYQKEEGPNGSWKHHRIAA